MAITHVASGIITGTGSASVGLSASFSGLGVQEGDLVIAVVFVGSAGDISSDITTSGYTHFEAELFVNDSYDTNLNYGYKFMGTTPDASVDCGPSTSTGFAQALMYSIYRGVDQTTPMDVTFWRGGSTNRMIPGWGTTITPVTDGAVIVALAGGAHNLGATNGVYIQGGDLSNFVSNSGNSTRDISGALGHYDWTTADGAWAPAAWTIPGSDSTSFSFISALVALRPAATGGYTLDAGAGSFGLTGNAATFVRSLVVAAAAGSFALSGQPETTLSGYAVPADAGSLSVSGHAATFLRGKSVDAAAGSFGLTGNAAAFQRALLAQVDAGAFAESGGAVSATRDLLVAADAGAFSGTGNAATFARGVTLAAGLGSFAASGQTEASVRALLLASGLGTFTETGLDASVVTAGAFAADRGIFSLTGNATTFIRGLTLPAGTGSFSETGGAVTFPSGLLLTANAGSFAVSGQTASFLRGYLFSADAGSFSETGNADNLLRGLLAAEAAGTLSLSGGAATFRYSGTIYRTANPGDGPNIVSFSIGYTSVSLSTGPTGLTILETPTDIS